MKNLQSWLLACFFAVSVGGIFSSVAIPQSASAACNPRPLLTLPAWYKGVVNDDCTIKDPNSVPGGLSGFIWLIVLNIIEIALQVVGYIAVFFILYGGFQFMTSTGSPDGATKARKTILNAVIGLIISIASVGIVNFIAGAIK